MAGISGIQPVTPVAAVVVTDPAAPPWLKHGGPASPVHEHAFWENGMAPYPWVFQPGIGV